MLVGTAGGRSHKGTHARKEPSLPSHGRRCTPSSPELAVLAGELSRLSGLVLRCVPEGVASGDADGAGGGLREGVQQRVTEAAGLEVVMPADEGPRLSGLLLL